MPRGEAHDPQLLRVKERRGHGHDDGDLLPDRGGEGPVEVVAAGYRQAREAQAERGCGRLHQGDDAAQVSSLVENADARSPRERVSQELEALDVELRRDDRESGHVPAGSGQTRDQPHADGVAADEDDGRHDGAAGPPR